MNETVNEVLHGRTISDPYRWLEAEEDAQVVAWCERQQEATRSALEAVAERSAIHQRLQQLLNIGWVGCPTVRRGRYFIMRRDGSQNQPVLYVRESLHWGDRVLLDPNTWSEAGTIAMDWYYPSDDGRLLAYGVSEGGDEKSVLKIIDVASGTHLSDVIKNTRACSLSWLPDSSGFYYTRYPTPGTVPEGEENYHRRVYFHALGTAPEQDPLVFGAGREAEDWPNVDLSNDGRWLLVTVDKGWVATDVYVFDRRQSRLITLVEGEEAQYAGQILGGQLYLMTNSGAPRYRLYRVDLERPQRQHWQELIAESTERVLDTFHIVGNLMFVHFMEKASSRLWAYDLRGNALRELVLPTLGSLAGLSGEWDGDEMFFGFNSYTVPPTVYRFDHRSGQVELFLRVEADIETDRYQVEQVEYPSRDGTLISMFLISRKGLSGERPTVLYGYGGFNVSMTPGFGRNTFLWLERGGLYAVANLRGGGEYGEDWHRAGMLANKQNVFDDFIAAAEWLIAQGYTTPQKLAISGGSNGGLLVGAALVQRPELFRAVVCAVPLLDMLRYHQFRIARLWIPEYGSADDPQQFEWLYAYSPYHHVRDGGRYPAVLLLTGEADSRVDPMHARKMAARLQQASASGLPVLLRVETKAGHGAGKPLSKVLEESTDTWSFIFWQLGLS